MIVYVDTETRSRLDLKAGGVHKYVTCPDFAILIASWSVDGGPVFTTEGDASLETLELLWDDEDAIFTAHNAMFDRVAFSAALGLPEGSYLDPERWDDTAAICAEYGWPTGLGNAAKAMRVEEKDTAGTALINLFCKPNRKGEWNDKTTHPDKWLDFIFYCEQDIETMRAVHKRTGPWPTALERQLWVADQRINDRGMAIDVEMCEVATETAEVNTASMKEQFTALTGVDNPKSVPQMMAWVAQEGLDLPNMQAKSLERVLANSFLLTDVQQQALELRQELALAAASKFSAALVCAGSDGRLRGGFKFFGAHTGRWAGQRVQPQNLPRHSLPDDEAVEAAILSLKLGLGAPPLTLKALVRAMFTGPLTVVDYSAIEARVVAWLAGEEWALQAFRDGRDIYVETAERMGGGMTRFHGKVAVLALGYQGGINSLRNMGAEGDDAELRRLVDVWRKANPNIVKLWSDVQNTIDAGGRIGKHLVINRRGSRMSMALPSGRSIHYHGVKWERYRYEDEETGKIVVRDGWRYDDPKRPGARIGTYGGRLVENATQAVARDLLAVSLVALVKAGYQVTGHVHDEVIVDGLHLEEVRSIMTTTPSWADGLPVGAEGYATVNRYRK